MRKTKAIDRYAEIQIGGIKRLKGALKNTWSLRVGDWRVFYTYESVSRTIVVARILHRSQAYQLQRLIEWSGSRKPICSGQTTESLNGQRGAPSGSGCNWTANRGKILGAEAAHGLSPELRQPSCSPGARPTSASESSSICNSRRSQRTVTGFKVR